MTQHFAPYVRQAKLKELRPTQFAVGYAEVEEKRKEWAKLSKTERRAAHESIVIPIVIGPRGALYPIDHHHEGCALLRDGQKSVLVHAVADLSALKPAEFWISMVMFGWCYLFDERGHPADAGALPPMFAKMPDDPYRSLAGFLRKAGGYAKSNIPFTEFHWANYLRHRVKAGDLKAALRVAAKKEADFLPGWVASSSAR